MRRYAKHGRHELGLKAAFIHRLTCDSKPLNCASATASPGSAPVIMFDDYLDAARKAEQHGLISAAGAQRVRALAQSRAAVRSMLHIPCDLSHPKRLKSVTELSVQSAAEEHRGDE
ncbi:hypothetical protein AK812_SmicGene14933 [Symbiodinium microadriaticum]|uniref:Uncharacterized protein n=1 Tax=Symbiodinium microadriaticum TaxID=2951 RepID=A0A1Q9E489_SYMMI|nr:hypothetical protein AK812_SmicGene14933 [Symbiodinium microadriaticum]